MVNLRKRPGSPAKSVAKKRTSTRGAVGNEEKFIENDDQDIDVEASDDESEESTDHSAAANDIEDILVDSTSSEDSEDEANEFSEDDREIQRIVERTEAETRNIPMTARQRAKLETDLPQPVYSSEVQVFTDEQTLKNSEKSRRRKLQRDAKVEETKRATIDRLLQKQQKKGPTKDEQEANEAAQVAAAKELQEAQSVLLPGTARFIDRANESFIEFPDNATFNQFFADFKSSALDLKGPQMCQVCNKTSSKYTHPSSGKEFCSLSCYKQIK